MKCLTSFLLLLASLALTAQTPAIPSTTNASSAPERLGTISFPISCMAASQQPFNRGVALLHDFWYEEAEHQFQQIAESDPHCAIAYWGEAMSVFQQIWNRPDEEAMTKAWTALQKADKPPASTARERAYIDALTQFFRPGTEEYPARINAYSHAMDELYAKYPDDVDAGAFDALALLAAEAPNDTSLAPERKALVILNPLFVSHPDHPGVAHYIIHACDTPSLASQGLAAAERFGEIAPSAPHAVHMPGHIFARLGMWQPDIDVNLRSVAASQSAQARHLSGGFDQLHADDFLLYAYLQSGQDVAAKSLVATTDTLLTSFAAMPDMPGHSMTGMVPYYRSKLSVFYDLEMRDWKAAAALQPITSAPPPAQIVTYWARAVAAGHLRDLKLAEANMAEYDNLVEQVRKTKRAYMLDSTGIRIVHGEMLAWLRFAQGRQQDALTAMRESADLQDKVGQGEVDIPAREMLGDMFLEFHEPQQALGAYDQALRLSPNRLNGLYHAGLAAEMLKDRGKAQTYYAALLRSTGNGVQSSRSELAHAKAFTSSSQVAGK